MPLLGPARPRFPIGISDFREIRRDGYTYVDKTAFVAGVIDSAAKSLLFPRPRRFGKTLNMTTLRYFLERSPEDRRDLFEGTYVWEADGGRYREHFQRYPVVYLTFKDVKAATWSSARDDIVRLLRLELNRLRRDYALDAIAARDSEDARWLAAVDGGQGDPTQIKDVLECLLRWLEAATGERVVLLVDEYDAPLHAAWQNGYWEEAVDFFRALLTGGYKDVPRLFRGVLTGILRVAKEGIFSGLNNLATYSVLSSMHAQLFGFTEPEVEDLCIAAGRQGDLAGLQGWYNGYRFGGGSPVTMYNPWSILNYLDRPGDGMQSFWKSTSSNDLIRDLLLRSAAAVGPSIEALLTGGSVEKTIDENVALNRLDASSDVLWALMTFTGYLTAESVIPSRRGQQARLRIPNHEVLGIFEDVFLELLRPASSDQPVDALVHAMLSGDAAGFERQLEDILLSATSYHDFGRKPVESVCQAFIVGLLVHMSATHRVRSNREAGSGRADVLVIPKQAGEPGCVLELKAVRHGQTAKSALAEAVQQLREKGYEREVIEGGAGTVRQYAVVLHGKRCRVERV